MSDFETHPIGTARRLAALEAATRGLLAEFAKFSRYGSPIAHQANEAVQFAQSALKGGDA